MGEVLFYHLSSSPLERTLPELLERCMQRGWRVIVRASAEARVHALDEMLWTYNPASFLPHGTSDMAQNGDQPILLTTLATNPNSATVLMLVDGARVDPNEVDGFERVCLIFNGQEEGALNAAREDWVAVKNAGLKGKYWAQDNGRWVEKATT